MATLDSPLVEALAFEYASFGVLAVVNNVWTWIAVVTAAVSFWRIRVTTSIGEGHACVLLEEEELPGSISEQESGHDLKPHLITGTVKVTTPRVKEMVTNKKEPLMFHDGVTKGKLTMYYEVGVDVDGGKFLDGELTEGNDGGGLGDCGEWWERWERVVRMRNGDDGWYRYVDLTVVNGNVVRLWDDNKTSNGGRCLN